MLTALQCLQLKPHARATDKHPHRTPHKAQSTKHKSDRITATLQVVPFGPPSATNFTPPPSHHNLHITKHTFPRQPSHHTVRRLYPAAGLDIRRLYHSLGSGSCSCSYFGATPSDCALRLRQPIKPNRQASASDTPRKASGFSFGESIFPAPFCAQTLSTNVPPTPYVTRTPRQRTVLAN